MVIPVRAGERPLGLGFLGDGVLDRAELGQAASDISAAGRHAGGSTLSVGSFAFVTSIVTELAEFVRLIRAEETSGKLELACQVVMLAEASESSLANGGVPVTLPSYSHAVA